MTLFQNQNDLYSGEHLWHYFFGFGSARMKLTRLWERRIFGGDDNQALLHHADVVGGDVVQITQMLYITQMLCQ